MNRETYKTDGQRLKEKRVSIGMTIQEVADKLGMPNEKVVLYESKESLTVNDLFKFAKLYRTHPSVLA